MIEEITLQNIDGNVLLTSPYFIDKQYLNNRRLKDVHNLRIS